MKKVILYAVSLILAIFMVIPSFAADNGVCYDFESSELYSNPEGMLSCNPQNGEVCVDQKDGRKLLKLSSTKDAQVRVDCTFKFSQCDFLELEKKVVFQYDAYFADLKNSDYQVLQFIDYSPNVNKWTDLVTIEKGQLLFEVAPNKKSAAGYETIEENKWYNFAVVMDVVPLTFDFYIDGVLVYSGNINLGGTHADNSIQLRIGSTNAANVEAYYDNIKLYSAEVPDNLYKPETPAEEDPAAQTSDAITLVSVACAAIACAGFAVATKKRK